MSQGIYQIKSKKTARVYIGSSVNLERRLNEHVSKLKIGKHDNPNLQSHFNEFGIDDLEFTILKEYTNIKRMRTIEIQEINRLKEINPATLFNVIGVIWTGAKRDPKLNILNQVRKEIIFHLYDDGYSNADIASMFNFHRGTIGRIVNARPKNWRPKLITYQAT